MRRVTLALLVVLLALGAVAAKPSPPPMSCLGMVVDAKADSLLVAMYDPPCARELVPGDRVASWAMELPLGRCVVGVAADPNARIARTTTKDCRPTKRTE